MTAIQVAPSRNGDPAADLGRALAALRKKKELDGEPSASKRKRYFLSNREHKIAKASDKTRVGGKPIRKPKWM